MTKLEGIILEGEKLGVEKYTGRDNQQIVNFHLLSGFESISMKVKDANLTKQLEELAPRKPVRIKATAVTFKDQIYLQATAIL